MGRGSGKRSGTHDSPLRLDMGAKESRIHIAALVQFRKRVSPKAQDIFQDAWAFVLSDDRHFSFDALFSQHSSPTVNAFS